jgi:hypothetical protein
MGLLYPMAGPSFEEALTEVVDPDALIASVEEEIQRCKDLFKQQADLFKAVACIEDYRVSLGWGLRVGVEQRFQRCCGLTFHKLWHLQENETSPLALPSLQEKMETVTPEDRLKNRGGLLQQLKRMERASNTAEKKVGLCVGFGK